MDWEFELVAGPYGGTTEGPAWDGQALLFTNIPNSRIMRYDPHTGDCAEYFTETNGTNGLHFDLEGRLYGCQSAGRRIVRFEAMAQPSQACLITWAAGQASMGNTTTGPMTWLSTARGASGSLIPSAVVPWKERWTMLLFCD